AVNAGIVINGQRLIVSHTSKGRLRIVNGGSERSAKVEDVLIEKRHLDVGIGIVEVDGGLQRSARHRYADTGREVCPYVSAEVKAQDQEFAIGWWEGETCGIEINHGGACVRQRRHRRFEGVEHRLRCWDERIESIQSGTSQ